MFKINLGDNSSILKHSYFITHVHMFFDFQLKTLRQIENIQDNEKFNEELIKFEGYIYNILEGFKDDYVFNTLIK